MSLLHCLATFLNYLYIVLSNNHYKSCLHTPVASEQQVSFLGFTSSVMLVQQQWVVMSYVSLPQQEWVSFRLNMLFSPQHK